MWEMGQYRVTKNSILMAVLLEMLMRAGHIFCLIFYHFELSQEPSRKAFNLCILPGLIGRIIPLGFCFAGLKETQDPSKVGRNKIFL